jgi:hypothetical protein
MCDKCLYIDKAIHKFSEVARQGFDPLTTDRMKAAIAEMEQRKAALHPMA